MLPKVANHIGRAVAAVHSQTTHAVRNVLQLQSSSSPAGNLGSWNGASSSSGWGNYGTGSGGAKYHAGSRFQSGYTGPGRAVTQAEPTSNDASNDDDDLPFPRRRGVLARRKSLSLLPQERPSEKLSVLRTVQSHVRSFNTLAEIPASEPPPPPPPPADEVIESRMEHEQHQGHNRHEQGKSNTALYNAALVALHKVRKPGESLQALLETYNEMLSRSILPNTKTYAILITALTDRDQEIHKTLTGMEWRELLGEVNAHPERAHHNQQQVVELRAENNFGSAFTLFQTICAMPKAHLPVTIYNRLLRSCAIHLNVDAAIYVFAHLEQRQDVAPNTDTFRYLLEVYTNVGDINGAKEVFEEYKEACRSDRIPWVDEVDAVGGTGPVTPARCAHLLVFNKMIEAYIRCGQTTSGIGLLEQMLDSKAGPEFVPADIPNPCPATYARLISAFCATGDVRDGLAWFERLLQQEDSPRHAFESSPSPTRPSQDLWNIMLTKLAAEGMVEDLNRLFVRQVELVAQDDLVVRGYDRSLILRANLRYLDSHPGLEDAAALKILDFLTKTLLRGEMALAHSIFSNDPPQLQLAGSVIVRHYLAHGDAEGAVTFVEQYISHQRGGILAREFEEGNLELQQHVKHMREFVRYLLSIFSELGHQNLSLQQTLRLTAVNESVGNMIISLAPDVLRSYARARTQEGVIRSLSGKQWVTILNSYVSTYKAHKVEDDAIVETIIQDLAGAGVNPYDDMNMHMWARVVHVLLEVHGVDWTKAFFSSLGPKYDDLMSVVDSFRQQRTRTPPPENTNLEILPMGSSQVRFNLSHSKYVDQFIGPNARITPLVAYHRYKSGVQHNVYPRPETIAQLIGSLGRIGEVEKMHELYQAAQQVMATMENHKKWQSSCWFHVEDHMIIGLAHAGDLEAAHVHRMRIIEHGGTPSADAYGALIHLVKDTTDDTSNAMALWQEAQSRGVVPNIYLYNTIISKLARARKADHALELFQQMKTRHLYPTSVTYGAVIAACCRVGDAVSAEVLFNEMLQQPNFRPRVPPYNTMMQLYTHTKPDRERVLHYFNALIEAKVDPTSHTYKLLIDAYGCIEPVDLPAVERVFEKLTEGGRPMIQGTHWASLINVYGCVQKDLDKALAIFDSIATHPSTVRTGAALPDAVVFEALINVLVTLRRPDLIPVYTQRLESYGVHMTAYIANLLIKGYAGAGDIVRAREIFEGLSDPPEGVAAPHNHAPHDDEATSALQVPVSAPVYREPSTWEAMVRAELGNSNRDSALALLERVKARKFPPAVFNRISGIMLDDSVSPWPASDTASSPTAGATTESSIPSP